MLSSWHDEGKRNFLDNFLYTGFIAAWLRFEYVSEKDADKREALKGFAMGGNSGKNWAASYNSRVLNLNERIGNMSSREAQPFFDAIDEICIKNKGKNVYVCQIGSSSGREIAYFAKKYPDFSFLGSDIYQEVIDFSVVNHKYTNLSFEVFSAKTIVTKLLSLKNVDLTIVFSSGSLQYVQPEHLEFFFKELVKVPNVEILLCEPCNESKGCPDGLKKSIWRGNFSYTHDYRFYAEEAGFLTADFKILRPYTPYKNFPMHKGTVHYYYHGTKK